MVTAIDHAPPYVPSYHTDFQNATLATTKANLSVETSCEYTIVSRATGMIDFKGVVDASKGTMLSGHAARPMVALSTASSIVVPSLDSQRESPSAYTTAVSRFEPTTVFVPSIWSKDFDTVVPTLADLEQNRSMGADTGLTHCALGGYYPVLSSLCSTLSGVYDGMTAQNVYTTSPRLVLDATNQTAIGSYTEAREPRTSAVLSSEDGTERASAQATKSRGQGDLPVAATQASSTTVPYQTLEKSQYGETDGSTIHPYDTVSSVTHPPSVSLKPQTTICTSGAWNLTGLSNKNTRTEAATNWSVSVPSTSPSAPPTLASTGHMATPRCISVLICLWAISILHN
jgi:hypothetical protein